MDIEYESPERMRITLTKEDMDSLGITYQRLDIGDEHSREVLHDLLDTFGNPCGISSSTERMLIEIYPLPDDGCIIYFSAIEKHTKTRLKRVTHDPFIFEFDSADDMINAVHRIQNGKPKYGKNELYLYGKRYRLIISPLSMTEEMRLEICEYGNLIGKGNTAAAVTSEHGRLISRNAISDIGRF